MSDVTTRIAVCLPDPMVAFLDRTVASGGASSRTALVGEALEREMRRRSALHDARVLAQHGAADDLDGVVDWTVGVVGPDLPLLDR